MSNYAKRLFLVAVLLTVSPGLFYAQDDAIQKLQTSFVQVAKECTPRVLQIKVKLNQLDCYGFGTGALISDDGFILTCAHCVPGDGELEVTLTSGKRFKAKRLGSNYINDFALIKIEVQNLPHFTPGDSDGVKTGDWVCALGYPAGPHKDNLPTFTAGRVRGLHRKLPVQLFTRYYKDAIETDIPAAPGSSGGPLIDLSGKLIGINGAILLLGKNTYSVPVNQIKEVMSKLKEGVQIEGAMPNIFQLIAESKKQFTEEETQQITDQLWKRLTSRQTLKLVREILSDELDSFTDMLKAAESWSKRREELSRKSGELLKGLATPENQKSESSKKRPYLGVTLKSLPRELSYHLNLEYGLLVTGVKAGKPAAEAGLKKNDILLELDGKRLDSVTALDAILDSLADSSEVKALILQHGSQKELTIKLNK